MTQQSSSGESFSSRGGVETLSPLRRNQDSLIAFRETALRSQEKSLINKYIADVEIRALDETDAALDEANSKRYADMVQELGEKSQLIVITHNRATMAAAGELYGVTMDSSGVSKVLSVKLEEAAKVAK